MKRLGVIVLTTALAVCLTACGGISKSVDLKYGETYKRMPPGKRKWLSRKVKSP